MHWKAALRPAIIVGGIFETVALLVVGRSDPLQGNWALGLQLLIVFLVPASCTWIIVMIRNAPRRPR